MSKLADQMADAADQLSKEFEKQQEKVLGAIENTVQTKTDEEKETERIKAEKIKQARRQSKRGGKTEDGRKC